MKALSFRQPWAWLIVNRYKNIENRTWSTKFRGNFLIHASRKFDWDGWRWVINFFSGRYLMPSVSIPETDPGPKWHRGGIVGIAEIVDCVTESDSLWFSGPYGFELENCHPLEFLPLKGKLKFFEVDANLLNLF